MENDPLFTGNNQEGEEAIDLTVPRTDDEIEDDPNPFAKKKDFMGMETP